MPKLTGGRRKMILGLSLLGLLVIGGIVVGVLFATGVIKTGGGGGSGPTPVPGTPASLDTCSYSVIDPYPEIIVSKDGKTAQYELEIMANRAGCVNEGQSVSGIFSVSKPDTYSVVLNGTVTRRTDTLYSAVLRGTIPSFDYFEYPVNGNIIFNVPLYTGGSFSNPIHATLIRSPF